MKKSFVILSAAVMLWAASSVSAWAGVLEPITAEQTQPDRLLAVQTTAVKATPVSVNVTVGSQDVIIEVVAAKDIEATLDAYADGKGRTLKLSHALLEGGDKQVAVQKGIIQSINVKQVGEDEVSIFISSMGNPKLTLQGNKYKISLNDIERGNDAAKSVAQLIPAPKAKAKPAPKAEAKPAPKAEAKPAPKAEAKPAPKAEAKPAPKAEAKPAPKAEAKPAPKAEAKPAPKAEAKPAPKAEAKPAPKAEAKPAPKAEAKPAPKAEAKPAPKAEAKPAPKAEAKPAPKAEAKPAPKAEAKPAPKAEAKPAPKAETKPTSKPVPMPTRIVPVTVKISNDSTVGFEATWDGNVRTKIFPYSNPKGFQTFIIAPATLATPAEEVAIGKGIIKAIRTRQVNGNTVAVDIISMGQPAYTSQVNNDNGLKYAIDPSTVGKDISNAPTAPATAEAKPAPKVEAAPKPAADVTAEKPKVEAAPKPAADVTAEKPKVEAATKPAADVQANNDAALPSSVVCDYFIMPGRDVKNLVDNLKGLFPKVKMQADPVLCVIVVEGPSDDIDEVRKLIDVTR